MPFIPDSLSTAPETLYGVNRPQSPHPQQASQPISIATPSKSDSSTTTTPLMSPERAASPLLGDDDPLTHLNIKLHAPLPVLSPPGTAQPIREKTPVHPVPIRLPSFDALQTIGSPQQQQQNLSSTMEGVLESNTNEGGVSSVVTNAVYDI